MNFETQGTLKSVAPTRVISDKFSVREFVVEIPDDKYPQTVQFQVTNDKCETLTYPIGTMLDLTFELRGRQWTDPKTGEVKTFNSLNAWKVKPVEVAHSVPSTDSLEGAGDLPF